MNYKMIGSVFLYIFLLFIFIGTKPYFLDNEIDVTGDTDPVRYIFIIFLLSYIFLFLCTSFRSVLPSDFLRKIYPFLFLYAFILFTLPFAYSVPFAFKRTMVLLIITFFLLAISFVLSYSDIIATIRRVLLIVLAVNIFSYLILPSISYDHENLFKGIHVHKNSAGAVFALSFLIFLYTCKNIYVKTICCTILFFFLIQSGSKTSLALSVLCIALVFSLNQIKHFGKVFFSAFFSVNMLVLFVIISYFGIDSVFFAIGDAYGDRSFTGRSIIWEYVYEKVFERPFIGWGYGSFWGLGNDSPSLFDGGDFLQLFGQAHNGYLDMSVQIGIIGLGLCLYAHLFFLKFMLKNITKVKDKEFDFLFTFAIFFFLHNLLESTIMQPFSVLWPVLFLLSISYLNGRRLN